MTGKETTSGAVTAWRGDFLFALFLAVAGVVAPVLAWPEGGILSGDYGWGTGLFFLLFGWIAPADLADRYR